MSVRIDQDQITEGEEAEIQTLLERLRATAEVHPLFDPKVPQDATEAIDYKLFRNMHLRKFLKRKLGTAVVLICLSKSINRKLF